MTGTPGGGHSQCGTAGDGMVTVTVVYFKFESESVIIGCGLGYYGGVRYLKSVHTIIIGT